MKRLFILVALIATACAGQPDGPAASPASYRLYDGPAPGSEAWDWEEYSYTDPAGDSYFTKEGSNVAEWLSAHGVAAFVLKYRLVHFARNSEEAFYSITGAPAPEYTPEEQAALDAHRPVARALGNDDGRAAIAYVRSHAAEFGVDPDRIGIMGFSAGGFLTSDVALNHTPESRPNLVAPIYGAATALPEVLPQDAAPLFVAAPEIDLFNGLTGISMVQAWRAAGLPAEAHYFACENHGFGYYPEPERQRPSFVWIDLLYAFMQKTSFLGE